MKSFEIRKSDISMDYRFEPSYYLYNVVIHNLCLEKGIEFDKMESLCTVISDGEHSAIPRRKDEGVRYLYGRNIKDGIINYDPFTDSSFISKEDYDHFTRIYVEDGDLLMTIVGTVGKVAVYQSSYVGTAGIPRHIAKIRLKRNSWATPEYLMAYFLSKLGKHQINNITTGNIQPLLSLNNIKKLNIPKVDSKVISEVTSYLRKTVDLETQSLSLIKKAQDMFYKAVGVDFNMLSCESSFTVNVSHIAKNDLWIPAFSAPIYNNALNAMADKWPITTIGELTDLVKGVEVGSDAYTEYLDKKTTDVPFVRTSDIVNYEIDQYPDFFVPNEDFISIGQNIKSGDVLFTKDGKIGMVALMTDSDKAIISSGFAALRIKANKYGITPEYLFTALSLKEIGIYASKRRTVVAATIPHLREERLKEIEIPVLDSASIAEITSLVKEAFKLKDEKKIIFKQIREMMDKTFDV